MVYNGFNFWIMVTLNMLSLNYYNHQAINNMSSNSRKNSIFLSNDFFLSLCGTTCTTRILFFYNFKYTKFFQSWYQKIAWFVSIFQFFLGDAPWTALNGRGNLFGTTHPPSALRGSGESPIHIYLHNRREYTPLVACII